MELSEERMYQLPYASEDQLKIIQKKLEELSGIARQPSHTSEVRGGPLDSFAYARIEHTWTTRRAPYIEFSYNPFKEDKPKTLTVKSNVVTPEMIQQVQKELGLTKAA